MQKKNNTGMLAKKMEEGFDTPMHTMNLAVTLTAISVYWCQCPWC